MLTLVWITSVVIFAGLVNRLEEPNKKNLKKLLKSLPDEREITSNRQLIFVKGYLVSSIKTSKKAYQLQLLIKELKIKDLKTKIDVLKDKKKLKLPDFYGLFETKFLPQKPILGDEVSLASYGKIFSPQTTNYYQKYLLKKGIILTGKIYKRNWDSIQIHSPIEIKHSLLVQKLKHWHQNIKKEIYQWFLQTIPSSSWGLSFALLTGDKSFISPHILNLYRSAGVYHLLAVSGMHAGIISLILFGLLRLLNLRKSRCMWILLFIVLPFYLLVTGFQVSIIRTYLMSLFGYLLILQDREIELEHLLLFTFFAYLFVEPWKIYNLSFQLSFTAVWGIFLALQFIKVYNIKKIWQKYFLISIGAQLFTTPVVLYYFGFNNYLTVFYNIPTSLLISFSLVLSICHAVLGILSIDIFSHAIAFTNELSVYLLKLTLFELDIYYTNLKGDLFYFTLLFLILWLILKVLIKFPLRKNQSLRQ